MTRGESVFKGHSKDEPPAEAKAPAKSEIPAKAEAPPVGSHAKVEEPASTDPTSKKACVDAMDKQRSKIADLLSQVDDAREELDRLIGIHRRLP